MSDIEKHRAVQRIAKDVLAGIGETITPYDTEATIATRAARMLADRGVLESWYYNCPALVLAGPRTCLSQSGRDYRPESEEIGRLSLVTVDLSPCVDGVWGDCARSFFVEGGVATRTPRHSEFARGQMALRHLHDSLKLVATPRLTFSEVSAHAMSQIRQLGFANLDFLGNVGHSIESELSQRRFLEPGNQRRLADVRLFTFEPHIKVVDGQWGFKHEEIYYFQGDELRLL